MSEQDGTHSSTQQRRSRKTNIANLDSGKQTPTTKRPDKDDKEAWKAFWKAEGQPWRIEPEIDDGRQKFLAERRSIVPYTIPNLFPFKDIKLSRADVEWLLATHDNGRGPVDWRDEKQRERLGIDLRGEDLSKLPMACLVGGLRPGDDATFYYSDLQQFEGEIAAIHLEEANLQQAILTEASLRNAHLEKASLVMAHMEGAALSHIHLDRADLRGARLEISDLRGAHLEKANLNEAFLEGGDLRTAHLEKADLSNAHLEVGSLKQAHLEGTDLRGAFLFLIMMTLPTLLLTILPTNDRVMAKC